MKRAAAAGLAFHPDTAAHQANQAGTDGQAQTRAAILPCSGIVGLADRLENEGLLIRRDANAGVGGGKAQENTGGGLRRGVEAKMDRYAALGGEFDSVAQQVKQHLT